LQVLLCNRHGGEIFGKIGRISLDSQRLAFAVSDARAHAAFFAAEFPAAFACLLDAHRGLRVLVFGSSHFSGPICVLILTRRVVLPREKRQVDNLLRVSAVPPINVRQGCQGQYQRVRAVAAMTLGFQGHVELVRQS